MGTNRYHQTRDTDISTFQLKTNFLKKNLVNIIGINNNKNIPRHIIKFLNLPRTDTINARITIFRTCMFFDSLENPVTSFSPFNISRSPPHDKNTFDSLCKIFLAVKHLRKKKREANLRSEKPSIRVHSIIISSARIPFRFRFSHSRWYITTTTTTLSTL